MLLRVSGRLDETHAEPELTAPVLAEARALGANKIAIDSLELREMNSSGVRVWTVFLAKLQAKIEVGYRIANELIVEQSGIVPQVLGAPGTRAEFFDAPYFCVRCKDRFVVQLKSSEQDLSQGEFFPPKQQCPSCKGPLEFDALEPEYLAFLKLISD